MASPSSATFGPGSVFGYYIETAAKCRGYLCRWPANRGADQVPGIDAPVTVLCFARNRTKLAKLRSLLRYLERERYPLETAPLGFFTRLNGMLEDSRTTLRTLRHVARTTFTSLPAPLF